MGDIILRYFKYLSNSAFKLHTDSVFNEKKHSFEINLSKSSSKVYSDYQELINYVCLAFLNSILIKEPSRNDSLDLSNKLNEFQKQKGKLSSSSNAFPALQLVSNVIQNKSFYDIIVKSKVLDAANTNKHAFKQIDFNKDIVQKAILGYNKMIEVLSTDVQSIITRKCILQTSVVNKNITKVEINTSVNLLTDKINKNIDIVSELIKQIDEYNDVKSILKVMKQVNDFRGMIARHQELTGQNYNNKGITIYFIDKTLKRLKIKKAELNIIKSNLHNQALSKKYSKTKKDSTNTTNDKNSRKEYSLIQTLKNIIRYKRTK